MQAAAKKELFDEIDHLINAMPMDNPVWLSNAVGKLVEIVKQQQAEINELRESCAGLRDALNNHLYGGE